MEARTSPEPHTSVDAIDPDDDSDDDLLKHLDAAYEREKGTLVGNHARRADSRSGGADGEAKHAVRTRQADCEDRTCGDFGRAGANRGFGKCERDEHGAVGCGDASRTNVKEDSSGDNELLCNGMLELDVVAVAAFAMAS